MYITFAPSSLLYGESVFLLATASFVPFFWHTDLERTRHRSAIYDIPFSRHLIWLYYRLKKTWVASRLWPSMISVAQIIYLLLYVVIGITLQRRILEHIGIPQEDTLIYRTIFYAPTVYRLCVLVISISALTRVHSYDVWNTYDLADYFAVDEAFQKRTMLKNLLTILPACIMGLCEIYMVLKIIPSTALTKFLNLDPGSWQNIGHKLTTTTIMTLALANVTLRYKSMIDLMYLCSCARKHINFISEQMASIEGTTATNRSIWAPAFDPRCSAKTLQIPQTGIAPIKVLFEPRKKAGERKIDQDQVQYLSKSPRVVLTNLNQFEQHLTQVQLFLSKADNESSASVFVTTFADSTILFCSILHKINYGSTSIPYSIGWFVQLTCIYLPPIRMFVLGHLFDRECRRFLNKLEIIYLQGQSHSLLYRQKSATQLIVGRLFKLIDSMRFDCNGLMDVNLYTLIQCALYIGGGVFMVLQYDLFLL